MTDNTAAVPKWKFRIQDVPPHGNCLFESVGRTIGIDAAELRSKTIQWMLRPDCKLHGESMSSWIEWNSGSSLKQYCEKMARNGEWGGGIELAVMSSMTSHAIVVYSKENGQSTAKRIAEFLPDIENVKEAPAICVMYVNRNHYMQMVPIPA